MDADQLLYNVSERKLRAMRPQMAVTVMIPEPGEPGKYRFITVQDTSLIEAECAGLRRESRSLSVHKNLSDGKVLRSSRLPRGIIAKVIGWRNWVLAGSDEKQEMEKAILRKYPCFLTTLAKNIGL